MTSNEIRAFWNLELRLQDDDQPVSLQGFLPYGVESQDLGGFKEKLRAGCFTNSLKQNPVMALWGHDVGKPLASTKNKSLRLKDSSEGLSIEMDLDQRISWARDAYFSIKNGNLSGLSFGFQSVKDRWPTPNLREVIQANLLEISPVTFAAYPAATVSARHALDQSVRAYWEAQNMRAFFGRRA